nr:thioesterase family protein [Acidimicrobiia bacterium]
MTEAFFSVERRDGDEWIVPTEWSRGPWDPEACHGGPPAAMLARAMEQALPALRLARISVDLARTVPMAGFRIATDIMRAGRATGNTRAAIVDADGTLRATATGMHVGIAAQPLFESALDNSGVQLPTSRQTEPGEFPLGPAIHGLTGFRQAVRVRYPPGEDKGPGATTIMMSTGPIVAGEEPSPFQRICPLADCGNAFSRHTDPAEIQFVNTDLLIALHRDPEGQWLGSR